MLTAPRVSEAPRAQPRDAQSDADGELIGLLMARKYAAEFEREFPPEERARYVGPFRFRWHSLAEYLRDDRRFADFNVQLTDLAAAGCPPGTESRTAFEVRLRMCRERVTSDLLRTLILRGATAGDMAERVRLVPPASVVLYQRSPCVRSAQLLLVAGAPSRQSLSRYTQVVIPRTPWRQSAPS
jgi:hypothetical protein